LRIASDPQSDRPAKVAGRPPKVVPTAGSWMIVFEPAVGAFLGEGDAPGPDEAAIFEPAKP
jgi:hypothetical protein